jgi:hypothetical protein
MSRNNRLRYLLGEGVNDLVVTPIATGRRTLTQLRRRRQLEPVRRHRGVTPQHERR